MEGPSTSEGADGDGDHERISATIIKALNHAVRRETLRQLHRASEPRSAVQLSRFIQAPGTQISYHLNVLATHGVIAPAGERRFRGLAEKFFASTVAENERIVAILAETEQDDVRWRAAS